MKKIICCTCNNNKVYVGHLSGLIRSINKNSPGFDICVRYVNTSDYTINQHLLLHDRILIINDKNDFSPERTIINSYGPHVSGGIKSLITSRRGEVWGVFSPEAYYCSHIKYDTIDKLLNIYNYDTVIYLDTDTIVRGDVNTLVDEVKNHDFGLYFEEIDPEEFGNPHCGLISLNNTSNSRQVINNVINHIQEYMTVDYLNSVKSIPACMDGDILMLYTTESKIKSLPYKYKDEGLVGRSNNFDHTSVMWSGRGLNKINSKKYSNERELYH